MIFPLQARPSYPSPSLSARPGSSSRSSSLPPSTVEYLKAWIMSPAHIAHPYPTDTEKADIMRVTGIEMKQLTNWFTNNRKRFWKPRITAMQENGTIANINPPGPKYDCLPSSPLQPPAPSSNPAVTLSNLSLPPSSADPTVLTSSLSSPSSIVTPTSPSSIPMSVLSALGSPKTGPGGISHQDVVSSSGVVTRYEVVDVYVLHPSVGSVPTIKDVTILSPKSPSRVLSSSLGRRICYTFHQSVINDRKRVQSRRDAEVVRVKKKLLREFLGKEGGGAGWLDGGSEIRRAPRERVKIDLKRAKVEAKSSPPTTRNYSTRRPRAVSTEHLKVKDWDEILNDEMPVGAVLTSSDSDSRSDTSCSTEADIDVDEVVSWRKRARRESWTNGNNRSSDFEDVGTWWNVSTPRDEIVGKGGGWKEVIMGRWTMGERELPTLEEAAVLFGFKNC